MAQKSYKASAPGSLMLFGEHAVLYGSIAIVQAIDKYITVTLTPRNDDLINIKSSLGKYQGSIKSIKMQPPWEFVLTALDLYKKQKGCDIEINSDFSATQGFGSSAAVTVATITVLEQWLRHETTPLRIFKQAKKVMLKVQGIGSGADIAASVFKGTIAYEVKPLHIEKLKHKPPLTVQYCGYKTPTVTVVKQVAELKKQQPEIFKNIVTTIDNCTKEAIKAINTKDWKTVGTLMNIHQGLQEAMGTSDATLIRMIYDLRSHKEIYGAKISGSGLGDCVIGLGKLNEPKTDSK